jgi:CubicO group peptidase (beta-lactamase class C family)
MYVLKPISLVFLTTISFTGCHHKNDVAYTSSDTWRPSYYVSIDGLWRCTPETSLKFPNGSLEPVIKISGATYRNLTVQGCFLWDSRYYDEWELSDIQFDDSTNQLTVIDGNGNKYAGVVDEDMRTIIGYVYSNDPNNSVPEDKLDFIRADSIHATRLFMPRIPDLNGSIKYVYHQPEQNEDGWQSAPIFQFTTDSAAVYDLMSRLIRQDYGHLESLIIIKDGRLILEEYFYGYDRSQLHNIHSCTKSITSLLLGMVLEGHDSMNVDQSIFTFLPQYDSLKTEENEQITVKHILTMTAGFLEEEDLEEHEPDDLLQYILSLPLVSKPGEKFKYSNDCSNLLGGIIYSLEGKQVDAYAEENLFGPLGILDYYWESENGVPHCHSDLHLLPRDMAKIGLLVLNDGKWRNGQVVPKKWIYESTKPHVQESIYYDYGYHWWHRSKKNVPWWGRSDIGTGDEKDKIIALGYGGQYIVIIRDLNMVVVTTASDYGNGRKARSKIPMVVEEIIPIFLEM